MKMLFLSICVLVLEIVSSVSSTNPSQIHISATETSSSIVVTWITFNPTTSSQVRFGLHNEVVPVLDQTASGEMTSFKDVTVERYVHRVTLRNLQSLAKYDYQCGSPMNWSAIYTMTILSDDTNFSPKFLVYGDLGYANAQSIPLITKHVNTGTVNAILHIGDFAYNLFSDDGTQGDKFMEMIEPVATKIPYMTVPGNHEFLLNFKDYRNRFSMPGGHDSIYYSLNIGPTHIIMFSTEVYIFIENGLGPVREQYEWLKNDLKQATTAEALAERPWIIAMAHRPMYCSTPNDIIDCERERSIIRNGLLVGLERMYPLEKLFKDNGVDIFFSAHEHIYERMWPLYDYKVMNGSYNHPYTNPRAPIHVVTGSAGCSERHSPFGKRQPEYVAYTSGDYGFTEMTVHNRTHLTIKQISDDQKGKVVDQFDVIKTMHGPEAYKVA